MQPAIAITHRNEKWSNKTTVALWCHQNKKYVIREPLFVVINYFSNCL